MQEIDRQFAYNEDSGMLKLLGVLCIIMAPLVFWMTFQDDPGGDGLWMIGKGWFAYIPAPMVPWVMRVMSPVLVWIGYALIKGAAQQKKFGGRIAFTPTGMIWEAGPPDGIDREKSYRDISILRVKEAKGQKVLYFMRAGLKCFIKSSQMRSPAEFNEMVAMLTERTQGKPATEAPVQT